MSEPIRIAMWSGPRNISTAMMRAFDARGDCTVVDEPFYAYYLSESGSEHPMGTEVLASQPQDWQAVVAGLMQPIAAGHSIQYQKQMAHHMVGDVGDDWFTRVRHAFLVRNPAEMIASYTEKRGSVVADDLGLARQVAIYKRAAELTGMDAPVIDASDVLKDPEAMLRILCKALGVAASANMTDWQPGRRDSDGVWASHWYNAVEASTGFAPYKEKHVCLSPEQESVLEQCREDYDFFFSRRLRI